MRQHSMVRLTAQLARLTDRQEIETLNANFCHCLDTRQYEGLFDLLAVDAHYDTGPQRLEGADAIVAFFKRRAEQAGPRTTRHMQSGLRLTFSADGTSATGQSVAISWVAHAPCPAEQIAPFMVADFVDVYQRREAGVWQIKARTVIPVLRNPAMAPKPVSVPEPKP